MSKSIQNKPFLSIIDGEETGTGHDISNGTAVNHLENCSILSISFSEELNCRLWQGAELWGYIDRNVMGSKRPNTWFKHSLFNAIVNFQKR